jgi:Ca-activated chloride channel family protein
MIHFLWSWSFLLLPLPWIMGLYPIQRVDSDSLQALKVPFLDELISIRSGTLSPLIENRRPSLWGWLAWICLIGALARPVWMGDAIEEAISGRDLMLAVDLSGSMEIEDFVLKARNVDRLTATKAVAGQFIERRVGDRLGLILFGDKAYLQVPLTFDRKTVRTLLEEAVIGLAGEKTAIGDAIGLAVKRLQSNPEGQRVLILLSDGANTAGAVTPLQAADLAARVGLKVYTIGIGADEMMIRDFLGSRKVNPSGDLDEATMRGIAEKTGGQYFRARDIQQMEAIYRTLDQLEPIERDKRYYRPMDECYLWPLALSLFFTVAPRCISGFLKRIPAKQGSGVT